MDSFGKSEKVLKLAPSEMFADVYKEMPKHIQKQQKEMKEHLAEYGEHYPLSTFEKE